MIRYLQIVHVIPGRTRLRCPAIRNDHDAADRVADALAEIPGVREVKVRPYTASILIEHQRAVTADALVEVASRVLGCERVIAPGEPCPVPAEVPELAHIAKTLAASVQTLDRDILRMTEGDLDLGTLVTLGFFGVGAAQAIVDRELPLPPWFNLAWWGYRTFMTAEQDEIAGTDIQEPPSYDDD